MPSLIASCWLDDWLRSPTEPQRPSSFNSTARAEILAWFPTLISSPSFVSRTTRLQAKMSELIHEKRDPTPSTSGSSPLTSCTSGGLDSQLLSDHLYPDDSYTSDGRYWADLPAGERRRFINTQSSVEAKNELSVSLRTRLRQSRGAGQPVYRFEASRVALLGDEPAIEPFTELTDTSECYTGHRRVDEGGSSDPCSAILQPLCPQRNGELLHRTIHEA